VVSAQVPPRTQERGTPATSEVSVFKCALPRRVRSCCPGWSHGGRVSAVSAAVISPVVPPLPSRGSGGVVGAGCVVSVVGRSLPALPLPSLIPRRTAAIVYGLSTLDDRGRLADRTIMQALGWTAGLGLDITETRGLLVIHSQEYGGFHVTGQGYLRVPAPLRHRCGLQTGDPVLLAADPRQGQLVVYPPAALDALIAGQAADSMDGESL